jgi:hypothetical protein
METGPSFKSDSSVWNKPLADIVFKLRDKDWLVNIGNAINWTFCARKSRNRSAS